MGASGILRSFAIWEGEEDARGREPSGFCTSTSDSVGPMSRGGAMTTITRPHGIRALGALIWIKNTANAKGGRILFLLLHFPFCFLLLVEALSCGAQSLPLARAGPATDLGDAATNPESTSPSLADPARYTAGSCPRRWTELLRPIWGEG